VFIVFKISHTNQTNMPDRIGRVKKKQHRNT